MNKFFTVLLIFISTNIFCQQGGISISPNGLQPDPSAALDINFNNKGLLIPRLSQIQRDSITSPAVGLLLYNTTSNCMNLWDGSSWRKSCYDCDFATPIISNNGPLCIGAALNLTASTLPGASYSWSGPNGFTSNVQNPVVDSITTAGGGMYTLQVTFNGCTSNTVSSFVTVQSAPQTPVASSNSPVCPGSVFNLSATSIANAIYSWVGPNGYTSNQQNPSVSNLGDTGTFTVSVSVNGCLSASSSTNLSLNPAIPSTPGVVNGPATILINQTAVVFNVGAVANASSYTWTVPNGVNIVSGNNTDSITVNWGSNFGNVCVTANNVCGSSAASCINESQCTVGWQYNVDWTQNNATYESSQLPGSPYNATNTMLNNGSFWLSNNGLITDQWIIYDLQSPHSVDEIQIANGQDPFGSKDMYLQTGASLDGPWTTVLTFTAADVEGNLQPFNIVPSTTSRYWRLYFLDNYGSVNYIKLEGLQFHTCP